MVEGLFVNRKLGRVSFVKELESGRILNEKGKGQGGSVQKRLSPSSPFS